MLWEVHAGGARWDESLRVAGGAVEETEEREEKKRNPESEKVEKGRKGR